MFLRYQPPSAAPLFRVLPPVGRRVGRARDLAYASLAAKFLDHRTSRFHESQFLKFRKTCQSRMFGYSKMIPAMGLR